MRQFNDYTSYESSRSSAYSDDQTYVGALFGKLMASGILDLGIDITTVGRIVQLFRTTASVSKKVYPAHRAYRTLNNTAHTPHHHRTSWDLPERASA